MLRGQNRQDRQLPSAVWEGLAQPKLLQAYGAEFNAELRRLAKPPKPIWHGSSLAPARSAGKSIAPRI
jgi:hypothetical protein